LLTDRQTDNDDYISSSAEVKNPLRLPHFLFLGDQNQLE